MRRKTRDEVVEAALQRELSETGRSAEAPAIPVFREGTGPRPGIDLSSNRALFEALDEGIAPAPE